MTKIAKTPEFVYRFFKELSHAQALLNGQVWLSTLNTCRQYENNAQGDQLEATRVISHGSFQGPFNSVLDGGFTNSVGFPIHLGPAARIENLVTHEKLRDGYLICATHAFAPDKLNKDFGEFCVQISKPEAFMTAIANKLRSEREMEQIGMANVWYATHEEAIQKKLPDHLVPFHKVESYQYQKEFRFLFVPKNTFNLEPCILEVPEVISHCSLVK
jgi:hypothetical protein